jgi:hypothetical protein
MYATAIYGRYVMLPSLLVSYYYDGMMMLFGTVYCIAKWCDVIVMHIIIYLLLNNDICVMVKENLRMVWKYCDYAGRAAIWVKRVCAVGNSAKYSFYWKNMPMCSMRMGYDIILFVY